MSLSRLVLVTGAVVTLFSSMVRAEDLPLRKAGLWESTMRSGKGNEQTMTVKQCVDAKTETGLLGMISGLCDLKWKRTGDDRIEADTTCKVGSVTASGRSVITGDFESNLRIESTTTTSGAGGVAIPGTPHIEIPPLTQTIVVEAKWIGPCEPGQKPGDIITPDGKVMQPPNMLPGE